MELNLILSLSEPERTEGTLLLLVLLALLLALPLLIRSHPHFTFLERLILALIGLVMGTLAYGLVAIILGAPLLKSSTRHPTRPL